MKASKIGWTDFSGGDLNFVTGCTPVSEGCQNCYARSLYERFGRDFTVRVHGDKLRRLIKKAFPYYSPKRGPQYKPMAFVCDTGDLFHESVPDDVIREALSVMGLRPDVVWQVLTKRARRMHDLFCGLMGAYGQAPPPNVWLGVTAENQRCADERLPYLLDTPATVRFVSVEPMLERMSLEPYMPQYDYRPEHEYWRVAHPEDGTKRILINPGLDWVICGAESGPYRRPFRAEWAEELWSECRSYGIPFFGKQDSGQHPGVTLLLRSRPWDGSSLRKVREWPDVARTGKPLIEQGGLE